MAGSSPRFDRQIRLSDIGLDGQVRIERSCLRIGEHLDELGRDVARRYARGAGISDEIEDDGPGSPELLALFRHSPSRSVAAGALAALTAIVGAVGQ